MYKTVARGFRKPFQIGLPLRAGDGMDAREFTDEEAIAALNGWMDARQAAGQPSLAGALTADSYDSSEDPGRANNLPRIYFSGVVNVMVASNVTHQDIIDRINDLATHLGRELGHTPVCVAYGDETWILAPDGPPEPAADNTLAG